MQLHLQVAPHDFANHWNAAQLLAGVQLGLGANSPFFYGKRLWAETRIPLFSQATDTRAPELKNQGVRPRVWFGERWITSIFDLFEENVQYFPALLPECSDEDPSEVFEAGGDARREIHVVQIVEIGAVHANADLLLARREPGAPRRTQHRRRHGERSLLLRRLAGARRG